MRIYPVPGRLVRDPVNFDILPADGRDVPESVFWMTLKRDGDVSLTPTTPLVVPVVEQVAEVAVNESKRRAK